MGELMGTYSFGAIAVSASALSAIVGLIVVRKLVPAERLKTYHEVAGYMLSVIGTLYAVLLGFVVVDAMTSFQDARQTVESEANAVANVFLLSQGLKPDLRSELRKTCLAYVNAVMDDEWEEMRVGKHSPAAFHKLSHLWKRMSEFNPGTPGEENVHAQIMNELSELSDSRRLRLVTSRHGVSPILWGVLVVGGIFTVVFTYFFALESLAVQVVMTALVAVTLSLNVVLVSWFGYPFAGDVAVQADAFELDRWMFENFQKRYSIQGEGEGPAQPGER